MKQLSKKIAAVCGAFLVSFSAGMTVSAELIGQDPKEDIMLPSGASLAEFASQLEEIEAESPPGNKETGRGREFASAAVAVFKGDEILYENYFGLTNIAEQMHADENSVYEWGSISKTMIWVSAMQLWEQVKIDLEADVRGYLPEGFFQHLSYDQPITMLNLMNHNAGWQEADRKAFTTDANEVLPLKEALQAIEPEQVHAPGEAAAYSNYGAAVAAYTLQCITGMDYAEYVRQNILEPLHMEHTAVNALHTDNEWVHEQRMKMHSYTITPMFDTCVDLGTCAYYITAYPSGAAVGTLRDLVTFAQALCDDSAPLFQNPETQKLMFSGTDFYGDTDIPICCHGFFPLEYTVRVYGHNGAMPFGQANMFFDLESKTGVITLCNEYGGNKLLAEPLSLAFGSLSPEKYRSSENPDKITLNGHYAAARGFHSGILKAASFLQAVSLDEEAEVIGGNAYQLVGTLIGGRSYSDGSTGLAQPSTDLIPIRFYAVKLLLFVGYVLSAVAAYYLLRIRKLLRKNGKYQEFSGSAMINISERCRLFSVLATFLIAAIYLADFTGIADWCRNVFCVFQILCAVVCAVSAAVSVRSVLNTQKMQKMRHILNGAASVLTVCTIVYFQLWKF